MARKAAKTTLPNDFVVQGRRPGCSTRTRSGAWRGRVVCYLSDQPVRRMAKVRVAKAITAAATNRANRRVARRG